MGVSLHCIRIAIAQPAGEDLTRGRRIDAAGVVFLPVPAVRQLDDCGEADAFVVDYSLQGAADFLRAHESGPLSPAIALVGREGPCRTVEQSLLRAEADGAALALPKPAELSDIIVAALEVLEQRATSPDMRLRLSELAAAYPR
jgi:hypothetical protein